MIHRKCAECLKRIPNERPQNVITCSKECARDRKRRKGKEWRKRTRRSDSVGPKYGGFVNPNVETVTAWRGRAAPVKMRSDISSLLSGGDPMLLSGRNEAAFLVKAPDMKNRDESRQPEES